ncbi:MAG: hypothetical protein IJD81_09560 [Oscillospiraceae bacterium]|nr:hypothetical protein [Oscillospiraceae bacterium]
MNTKHLNMVFQHYIEKFEWLNSKPEPDESYKWIAVHKFQSIFNLNIPIQDFPFMLYNAWKATENLIDSNQQQPFFAMVEYARKEPHTVYNMFVNLFADDGGDLLARQKKIDVFIAESNILLNKYFPSSHLYVNNQRSVMAYLWFYDPNTYYYYKATEAKYLADCVEFYDDWGTYTNFKLDVFHRFCDEIIYHIRNNPALIDTHLSRFNTNDQMHKDENLHILLVDIIFCAKRYGLYSGISIKETTSSAKKLYLEQKQKAIELRDAVYIAEKNLELLNEAKVVFSQLIDNGAPVIHKSFGKGKLVELSDGSVTLSFPHEEKPKKFNLLQSLVSGFLYIDDSHFEEVLSKYRQVIRIEAVANQQLKRALNAFEPYKEYLD